MRDYDLRLLSQIWELQRQQASETAPAVDSKLVGDERTQAGAAVHAWHVERAHGPRVARLHRDGYNDTARKRVSRALARLEAAGLVRRWGEWANITHVRLTAEGERLAGAPAPSATGPATGRGGARRRGRMG
jgi:hypothetical protein